LIDVVRDAVLERKVVEELSAMEHHMSEHDGRELGLG
jgi:hypothetical protein